MQFVELPHSEKKKIMYLSKVFGHWTALERESAPPLFTSWLCRPSLGLAIGVGGIFFPGAPSPLTSGFKRPKLQVQTRFSTGHSCLFEEKQILCVFLHTQFLFIYIKFPESEPFWRQIRLSKINCELLFTSSDVFLTGHSCPFEEKKKS